MSRSLVLGDADGDLNIVDANLQELKQTLAMLRQQTAPVAASIAVANESDPDRGDAARLRAMTASCCDGIAHAISETEKHAAIVRDHLSAHPEAAGNPPTVEIHASWQRFVSAFHHARKGLDQLRTIL